MGSHEVSLFQEEAIQVMQTACYIHQTEKNTLPIW